MQNGRCPEQAVCNDPPRDASPPAGVDANFRRLLSHRRSAGRHARDSLLNTSLNSCRSCCGCNRSNNEFPASISCRCSSRFPGTWSCIPACMGDEMGYASRISKKVLARLSGLPLGRIGGWRQRGQSAALRHCELGKQNLLKKGSCNNAGNKRECCDDQAYSTTKAQHISQCHGPASCLLRWIKA